MEDEDFDEKFLMQIKTIKENVSFIIQWYKRVMVSWYNETYPNVVKTVPRGMVDVLSHEKTNQESITESLRRNSEDTQNMEQIYMQLKDLDRRELSLKEEIKDMNDKINKFKQTQDATTDLKRKLDTYKELAKASKKLTNIKFNYEGPHISGVIVSNGKLHTFDFNSCKLKEKNISNCLWKHLQEAAGEDWSDIFSDDQMEIS